MSRDARRTWVRGISCVSVGALVLAFAPAAVVSAQASPTPQSLQTPAALSSGTAATSTTSKFQRTAPHQPIPRPAGVAANANAPHVARAFLSSAQSTVEPPNSTTDLATESVHPSSANGRVVRFQQKIHGIPILGGETLVDLDQGGNIRSASSETLPGAVPKLNAPVNSSTAKQTGRTAVARSLGVPASSLAVTKPEQWIFDPRILGTQKGDSTLVWRMEVTGRADAAIKHLVLIDAHRGFVALDSDEINESRNRTVCDAANSAAGYPCTSPVRTETGPTSSQAEVNKAFTYAGDTYDFYHSRFGRDSIDNAGMTLKSTVRYCPPGDSCPYQNAFWNGQQMTYGDGFAAADDVVGHELTHGVTEYTSDLVYSNQSGAINESLSDIFGEFIDLTNSSGTDTAETRWQMGEDIPGFGVIRNMKNPPQFGDPDRMGSPYFYTGGWDNGGVHTNSGVGNKFAYLLTDGETFNGYTVTGLGIDKAALIIYWAANLLTSGSEYADFGQALLSSCASQVGTHGITTADCAQVSNAAHAVEIIASPPPPPPPGTYAYSGSPVVVPDNNTGGASAVINIPAGVGAITNVKATIGKMNMTWDGDLSISLTSPSGTTVDLSRNNGGSGDNYINTVFDDAASTPITSGSAPFTGSFRPQGSLASFNGQSPTGSWTLKIVDNAGADIATLRDWSVTVVGVQQAQTISFTPPLSTSFSASPVTAAATASSGLAVVFSSTTPSTCSVSGAAVTLTAVGTCTIAADQAGNSNYSAAPQVLGSFAIVPATQTISFTAPASRSVSSGSVTLTATATSGLPVAFSSSTPSVCTLTGSVLTPVSAGTCGIDATQAGNDNWSAASPVSGSLVITPDPVPAPEDTPSPTPPPAPTVPAAPAITKIAPGVPGRVRLNFVVSSNGGSKVTSARAQCISRRNLAVLTASAGSSPVVVAGLKSGQWYDCKVRAINAIGPSPWSASAAFHR